MDSNEMMYIKGVSLSDAMSRVAAGDRQRRKGRAKPKRYKSYAYGRHRNDVKVSVGVVGRRYVK